MEFDQMIKMLVFIFYLINVLTPYIEKACCKL